MKFHNNPINPTLPDMQVAICYKDLYNDYNTVNPYTFIENIPTLSILNFVVSLQNRVLYAISDTATQKCMIKEMCPCLDSKVRHKAWLFQKNNQLPLLMSCETSFLMFQLALSSYVPFGSNDELDLCKDEMQGVYKAILFCNQRWTDIGCPNNFIGRVNPNRDHMCLAKLSVCLDLPIVEFKFYKDFRTQFYKAIQFFKFCESDPVFSTYLQTYCSDHLIRHWKEYLLQLFYFFESSLKNQYVSLDSSGNPLPTSVPSFFDQFAIVFERDADTLKELWKGNKGMTYLREHFLLRVSEKNYLLLNSNLLVDKIYQGMKFDFFKSVKEHGLLTKEGSKYLNYSQFSSVLGEVFSEPKMLYPLLRKCFGNVADKLIDGNTFKSQGMDGEPDFYMRENDTLFLFEYKDLTLGDSVKFSQDPEFIKIQILERLCYDGTDSKGNYKRKGGGQLLATINKLINNHSFDQYDSGVNLIKKICPIIVTTDSAFSSLGINALVIEAFDKIRKEKAYKFQEIFVSVPVIIDFDTLIKLCYIFSVKKINLWKVIWDYIQLNSGHISPFSTYVIDNILKEHSITKEENKFLFSDFFAQ